MSLKSFGNSYIQQVCIQPCLLYSPPSIFKSANRGSDVNDPVSFVKWLTSLVKPRFIKHLQPPALPEKMENCSLVYLGSNLVAVT